MPKAHLLEDANDAQGDLEKHAAKQIDKFDRQCARIKAFLAEAEPRRGPNGKERKSNVTVSDSGKMKAGKGVIRGYTAVVVTDGKRQVIVEARAHATSCWPRKENRMYENRTYK